MYQGLFRLKTGACAISGNGPDAESGQPGDGNLLGQLLGVPVLTLSDEVVGRDVDPLRPVDVQLHADDECVVDDESHRRIDLRDFDVLVGGERFDVALGQVEGGLLPVAFGPALGDGDGEALDELRDIVVEVGLLGCLPAALEFQSLVGLSLLLSLLLLEDTFASLLLRTSERRSDEGSGSVGHDCSFQEQ